MATVDLDEEWPKAKGTVEVMLGRHSALLDGNGNGERGLVSVVARIQTEETIVRDRQHRINQRWMLLVALIPVLIKVLTIMGWLPK